MGRPDHDASGGGERDLLVAACAISAGVHAALAPAHLREAPPLGWAFVLSSALLAATAIALDRRRGSRGPARAATVLLAGLIASYAATRAWHVPGLGSTPEPVDAAGLATKVVEAAGLLVALHLSTASALRPRAHVPAPRRKGRP